jgi:GntR family transcriptional regulator/MocR family aminotransferase
VKGSGLVAQVDARAVRERQRYSSVAWQRVLSDLDRKGRTQFELMRVLSSAIERRELAGGVRLPSGRELARMLGVSRNTVIAAISDLVDQGYLVARERSGVFIADPLPPVAKTSMPRQAIDRMDWSARFSVGGLAETEAALRPPPSVAYSFDYGQFDFTLFPIAHWRECERAALGKLEIARWARDMGDEDDVELVEELRKHILPYYGIWSRPDEILITLGGQQGRYLVAQLLSGRGTLAGIEFPGLPDMANILRVAGAEVRHLPVDQDGLMIGDAVESCDTFYVTPDHQNPTTVTMPLACRQDLLKRAASGDIVVVEDTFETEFVFHEPSLPSLRSLDGDNRVVHVGSLSKLMAPGLRLGYVVASPTVIRELRALRRLMHRHPPGNNQRALAIFIRHGHYRTYLRRAAVELARRSAALAAALDRRLPDFRWRHRHATSSFWIELPAGLDADRLCVAAERRGVRVTPGRRFFSGLQPTANFIRLAVSTLGESQICEGIRRLAEARAELG